MSRVERKTYIKPSCRGRQTQAAHFSTLSVATVVALVGFRITCRQVRLLIVTDLYYFGGSLLFVGWLIRRGLASGASGLDFLLFCILFGSYLAQLLLGRQLISHGCILPGCVGYICMSSHAEGGRL